MTGLGSIMRGASQRYKLACNVGYKNKTLRWYIPVCDYPDGVVHIGFCFCVHSVVVIERPMIFAQSYLHGAFFFYVNRTFSHYNCKISLPDAHTHSVRYAREKKVTPRARASAKRIVQYVIVSGLVMTIC